MVRNDLYYRQAIALRRKGNSYNEILSQVPVAKSTIALWLRSVGLSKRTRHKLTEKKRLGQLRGGKARHDQRVALVHKIFNECQNDIQRLTKRELLLMGVTLYWAEGSKEKAASPGSGVRFTNSDPRMIRLFLVWLKSAANVPQRMIHFSLYIHINQRENIEDHRRYWAEQTGRELSNFEKVYYKKVRAKTNRSNIGDEYHGVVNVMVRSSSILLRKIAGWTEAISNYNWGVV